MSKQTGPSDYDRRQWAKMYAYLLAELDQQGPLLPEDHAELTRRGLTDVQIKMNGYRSLGPARNEKAAQGIYNTFKGRIWDLPGIVRRPDGKPDLALSSGILIPMKDSEGWIKALQVRTQVKGSKYVWFTKGGRTTGDVIHFAKRPQKGDVWFVTEGPLKADVAQALDPDAEKERRVYIAPGGVGAWGAVARLFDLVNKDEDSPWPEGVVVAFDQEDKPGVANGRLGLLAAAKKHQLPAFTVKWDGTQKGVDDALAAGAVLTLTEV